jgi:hypothetical protein
MSDDIEHTAGDLERHGIVVERPFSEQAWGRLAFIRLPGGGGLGIYQPRHPMPRHEES